MEQDKSGAQQTKTDVTKMDSGEQGRQPDAAQQPAEQSNDISQVDQQEGQMNNGELGGNFNAPAAGTEPA